MRLLIACPAEHIQWICYLWVAAAPNQLVAAVKVVLGMTGAEAQAEEMELKSELTESKLEVQAIYPLANHGLQAQIWSIACLQGRQGLVPRAKCMEVEFVALHLVTVT